jgi:hypothetical protein
VLGQLSTYLASWETTHLGTDKFAMHGQRWAGFDAVTLYYSQTATTEPPGLPFLYLIYS